VSNDVLIGWVFIVVEEFFVFDLFVLLMLWVFEFDVMYYEVVVV